MYKVVRAVALAVFVSSVSAAVAQNVPIQPLWTANYNYSEGEARFSRDGSTLIASGRYGLVYFRTSDWRTIGTRTGANTMFVPTDDGKATFAPQEGLNKIDLATGARSFVAPFEQFYYLSISRDGSKLGWWNAETGKAAVTLFDLVTGTRRLVKLPSLDDIRGIEFLPDNNSFVTSGPNLFKYDGTRPYKKTNYAKGFAVSADGLFAYQLTPTNQLAKFKVADGKQVWIKEVPDLVSEFVGLTSDGKGVVLCTVMADNRLGLAVHSTATGARLAEPTKTEAFPKTISPIANQVVLSHSAAEAYLKVVSVDTTTGAVTPVLNLSEAGGGNVEPPAAVQHRHGYDRRFRCGGRRHALAQSLRSEFGGR